MKILVQLILLVIVFIIGKKILFPKQKEKSEQENEPEPVPGDISSECCGAHEICEVDEQLLKSEEVIYFDDEELDRYKGVDSALFSDQQIDEFRDILYTLQTKEINSWLKSLEMRNIQLPAILHQEARQLITDELNAKKVS